MFVDNFNRKIEGLMMALVSFVQPLLSFKKNFFKKMLIFHFLLTF